MKNSFILLCLCVAGGLAFGADTGKSSLDKPDRLFVLSDTQTIDSYSRNETTTVEVDGEADDDDGRSILQSWHHFDYLWHAEVGGHGSQQDVQEWDWWDYQNNHSGDTNSTSAQMSWLADGSGREIDTANDGLISTNVIGLPVIAGEHCVVSDPKSPPPTISGVGTDDDVSTNKVQEEYFRFAQTKWRLETGGRAMAGRKSLWRISGGTKEVLDKRAVPLYYSGNTKIIPPQQVIILSRALYPDGNSWRVLPDGAAYDATPFVAGKDFYSCTVAAQKYKLTILASSSTTNADLSTNTPEFCVGQKVAFTLDGLPQDQIVSMVGNWNLPDKFVNQISYRAPNDVSHSENMSLNPDLLRNTNKTSCWYVNGAGGVASLGLNLHFTNGQYASVAAHGSFSIFRPSFSSFNQILNNFSSFPAPDYIFPYFEANMAFYIELKSKYDGWFGIIQIMNSHSAPYDTGGADWLDGSTEIYGTANTNGPSAYIASDTSPQGLIHVDSPAAPAFPFQELNLKAAFKDYLVFKPDGADSIYVTIATNGWFMDGQAYLGIGVTKSNIPPATTPVASDEFPMWQD